MVRVPSDITLSSCSDIEADTFTSDGSALGHETLAAKGFTRVHSKSKAHTSCPSTPTKDEKTQGFPEKEFLSNICKQLDNLSRQNENIAKLLDQSNREQVQLTDSGNLTSHLAKVWKTFFLFIVTGLGKNLARGEITSKSKPDCKVDQITHSFKNIQNLTVRLDVSDVAGTNQCLDGTDQLPELPLPLCPDQKVTVSFTNVKKLGISSHLRKDQKVELCFTGCGLVILDNCSFDTLRQFENCQELNGTFTIENFILKFQKTRSKFYSKLFLAFTFAILIITIFSSRDAILNCMAGDFSIGSSTVDQSRLANSSLP